MKKMKNKSVVSILLVIIMVASLAFTVLPSIKAEATSPLGLKFNGISEGTWFFGKTSSGTVENGFYKVAAKIDGEAHEVVMEYDGNQFMIYTGFFSGTPGTNSKTPTTSLDLEKSAILTKVDSNGWSAISEGASYVLGNEVQLVYENGEWVQTALTPIEIGIKYNGIAGGNWFFGQSTSVDLMNQFYQVEALLDGVSTTVMMEYSSGGMQFIMYGSGFPSTYNPTTSIKFAKGAILTPLIYSGGWSVVNGGQTYTLQNELNVVYDSVSSSWLEKEDENPSVEIEIKYNGLAGGNWFFGQSTSVALDNSFYQVEAELDGVKTLVVIEYASSGNQFIMYGSGFPSTYNPTTSIKFAEGAVLSPYNYSGGWVAVEGGQTYVLGNTLEVVYDSSNSSWAEKKEEVLPIAIKLGFNGISNGDWFFSQETQTAPSGFYKVAVEINGTAHEAVMEYGNDQMMIYSNFFSGTPGSNSITPTTAFKIAKDAILTPVSSSGWSAIEDGQTYIVSEELSLVYENSEWIDDNNRPVVITPIAIKLGFNGISNGDWFFSQETQTAPSGFYKVAVEINGTAHEAVMEYGNNQMMIYSNFFSGTPGSNSITPTTAFKIAKDAVLTPVSSSGWSTIEDGQTYTVSEELSLVYENSEWIDDNNRPVVITPIAIKLGFNGISNGTWFFSQESQTAPSGFYKVPVEINGTAHEAVMEYGNDQMMIYSNFFSGTPGSNSITPTTAFKIAKDAILTPVSSSGWSAIEDGQTYIVSEELSLVYKINNWFDANNCPIALGLRFNAVDSNAWYFDITTDMKLPSQNQFYRVQAEVDGASREILIEYVHKDLQMQIYPHTFRPNLSVSGDQPTQSFKIAKGAVFTPVESTNWTETTGEKYILEKDIDVVKDGESWKKKTTIYNAGDVNGDTQINAIDLVRLKRYLNNTSSTTVGIGADFEWSEDGSAIDNNDVKSLRELLVGKYNGNMYLVCGGGTAYKIVYPTNATENEKNAASELQGFIYKSSEVMLDIISEEATVAGGKYIYVGNTKSAGVEGVIPTLNEAGYNGFVVDLINTNYYLCGYSDIGTCNAVYEFLMKYFGYECYAIDEVTVDKHETVIIDKKPEVAEASRMEGKIIKPTFEWREHNYGEIINSSTLTRRMRMNATEEIFALGHDSHNTFNIVSPITAENTYNLGVYDYTDSTYKLWYSHDTSGNTTGFKPDGVTYRPYQLCFSNEEMYAQFLANVKTLLANEEYASAPNFLIGMEDNENWCTCSDCTAAKNTYGSDSAVVVQFINKLQDDMNGWCEEQGRDKVHFVLFAYKKTESAPTSGNLKLHEDAGVMFAPIQARYDVALTDNKNATSKANYDAWLNICDKSQMYIWSYSLLTQHGWIFADTTEAMSDNYNLYKGATMIVEETDHYEKFPNSGFSRLKAYLMSKKQWDNSLVVTDLEEDFFANYFDDAAPIMKNIYEKLSTQLATIHNTSDGTISENLLSRDYWKIGDFRNEAGTGYLDLIEDAYEAIAPLVEKAPRRYEQLHDRIELEALQFEYIVLDLFPDSYDSFDALMSARQNFKDARVAYVNAYKEKYPASADYEDYYREGKYASDLWKAWGLDVDYKDTQKVISIELGSSGSVKSSGSTQGEMQLTVSNDGALTSSNTKYNEVTNSILSKQLYAQGTAFVDGVRYNNLQVYLQNGASNNLRLHHGWVKDATSVVIPKNTTFVTFDEDTSYIITFNATYTITKSGNNLNVTTE